MSVGVTKWARLRIILVGLGLACFGLVITGRFFQLQIIQGSQLREVLDREVKKNSPVLPVRGTILDRHGKELAVSTQVSSLVAHPNQIKNADLMSRELSKVLGISYYEIKKIITRARPFVFVKRCLTPEKEEAFRLWKEKIESQNPQPFSKGKKVVGRHG